MDNFDATQLLTPDIAIKSAHTHTYRIGLSLFRIKSAKRSKFHNPLIIFIINLMVLIRNTINMFLPEQNQRLFIILGDFSYFIGIRVNYNISCSLYILLALTSQLVHYYNYKNGIKLSYLKVFEMMSGLVSPKSIGLTDKQQIYRMIKLSKNLFIVCKLNIAITVPIFAFMLSIVPYLLNCTLLDMIIFGIPHSLLLSICCYYIFNINLWQVVYFYLMCHYIKIKLKEINNDLGLKMKSGRRITNINIRKIIQNLSQIYSEIYYYNDNYWSKYLLTIWILHGSVISTTFYTALFGQMHKICRIVIIYVAIVLSITFLSIVNIASSVTLEVNRSYKILNHVMVSDGSHRKISSTRKLKVK